MIPTFHDYSLEPKITKCGDLLYFEINWPLKEKVSHLYLKNWGEMWMFKKHNPTLLNNLKKYFHVICLKVIPKLFKMKCLILCDEICICSNDLGLKLFIGANYNTDHRSTNLFIACTLFSFLYYWFFVAATTKKWWS